MDNLTPMPELSPKQYLLLLTLFVLVSSCEPIISWFFPLLTGNIWLTVLPPVAGLYQLMLLFRNLGVIQLPNAAYYSAVLAPLSVLSFYQFVLQ